MCDERAEQQEMRVQLSLKTHWLCLHSTAPKIGNIVVQTIDQDPRVLAESLD